MSALLKVYHHLPPFARNVAATARGYYLRWWRYGATTEQLVEEALERDYWSQEQWKNWQEQRVAYVLHHAATRVPYYQEQWNKRRRNGDTSSWEYLENWPILEKEALRSNASAFVADNCNIKWMFHEHTSGTTGTPLDLWWSRSTVQTWYALFEARWRRWYQVSRHDRWAMLGGQLVTPIKQNRPPFWIWNAALNQLYMSSYHLAPRYVASYAKAIKEYKVHYIWGYTSALYELASGILENDISDIYLKAAITNAEPVYDYQRETIENAFHCPVRETYGMAEIVVAASECETGHLHLWPEVGCLEITKGEKLPEHDEAGNLICTGLLNMDMPLIRYQVGDRGVLAPLNAICTCGKQLPLLKAIDGRADDTLFTSDGRRIGRLAALRSKLPVKEVQIIQENLTRIHVRYVPGNGFNEATKGSIRQRLQERMGDKVDVKFEQVELIPRSANGKFRAVICNLSPEERSKVMR